MTVTRDLWEYLAESGKTVVMYGMGNGADKILGVCEKKGITVSDFFASDGFVRGHLFHGKRVMTYGEICEKYGRENIIVLLSFGSSRPEVLENIYRIAGECELYAPDVPAFGDTLFDRAFYEAHKGEFEAARELMSDEESKEIFDAIVRFKLTGDVHELRRAESDPTAVMRDLIRPNTIKAAADLGAYNGDTVRELLSWEECAVEKVWAMEPDARNYRKLQAYAAAEARADVIPVAAGAWSECGVLTFDGSGNRNASFGENRSDALSDRPVKLTEIRAETLDAVLDGARVDYIKYDVEGSEKEALIGSTETIRAYAPRLLVSLYHRSEDLFSLPLLIKELFPDYKSFYLRRYAGVPAWDLMLIVTR